MRVLTIYAHHNPRSFCHALLSRFEREIVRAIHAQGAPRDVQIQQEKVAAADALAFVSPLCFVGFRSYLESAYALWGDAIQRPTHQRREEQERTRDDEEDRHERTGRGRLTHQLPYPAEREDCSDHEGESFHGKVEVFPRDLDPEDDDSHTEETCAPAERCEERDPDPDEEEAPPGGVELLRQHAFSIVDHGVCWCKERTS